MKPPVVALPGSTFFFHSLKCICLDVFVFLLGMYGWVSVRRDIMIDKRVSVCVCIYLYIHIFYTYTSISTYLHLFAYCVCARVLKATDKNIFRFIWPLTLSRPSFKNIHSVPIHAANSPNANIKKLEKRFQKSTFLPHLFPQSKDQNSPLHKPHSQSLSPHSPPLSLSLSFPFSLFLSHLLISLTSRIFTVQTKKQRHKSTFSISFVSRSVSYAVKLITVNINRSFDIKTIRFFVICDEKTRKYLRSETCETNSFGIKIMWILIV